MTVIVDTNVILVANGQHDGVSAECVSHCARRLLEITERGRVALDEGRLILGEYQNKTAPHEGKRAGDAFLKWLLRNDANRSRCDLVSIEKHEELGFASFPEDARLRNFDAADRKFVAVASAHAKRPPILQAADSKWIGWAPALEEHGIRVEFLCKADLEKFAAKKSKGKAGARTKKTTAKTKKAASRGRR